MVTVSAWTATRLALAGTLLLAALTPPTATGAPQEADTEWFTAWSRPQSVALAAAADPLEGGRGPGPLLDQTVRNVVRVTGAGTEVRLRLSNHYGATLSEDGTLPLTVSSTTVARHAAGAELVPGTLREVTFSGQRAVSIPAGATVLSDPVLLAVAAGHDLAVSLHVPESPMAPQHGASFVTSYLTRPGAGDRSADLTGMAYGQRTLTTLVLTGVDVRSSSLRGLVAATGSSVTDGHGSDVDGHTDFPSWLARRIQDELPPSLRRTVVNNGLGGTTAAAACATPGTGPSVEERVAHDSLQLSGLTHLVVYAGTNDIAGGCTAGQIIAAYREVVRQAQQLGVSVLISTITPRASYTAAQNAERDAVNAWVRGRGTCSGECHRGLDFDVAVRDPANPQRIDPAIDSGDGIHPNGEGYGRIAASIPLAALR